MEKVYTKKVQQEIDRIDREIRSLSDRVIALHRRRNAVICGQSPIKPGALITWVSNAGRTRVGRVREVLERYNHEFEYRCELLSSKGGRVIGMANVNENHHPELLS